MKKFDNIHKSQYTTEVTLTFGCAAVRAKVKGDTERLYIIFTFAYTMFRCVVLTNMCVYVPSNTTVILDGVYLLALGYMFRPLLGHHQTFYMYVILVHCFYIILHLHL
jgi:hypothetical protein